jgi:hypothetical protein
MQYWIINDIINYSIFFMDITFAMLLIALYSLQQRSCVQTVCTFNINCMNLIAQAVQLFVRQLFW